MADLYVCPVCSKTYPDGDAFFRHAEITGHAMTPDIPPGVDPDDMNWLEERTRR